MAARFRIGTNDDVIFVCPLIIQSLIEYVMPIMLFDEMTPVFLSYTGATNPAN